MKSFTEIGRSLGTSMFNKPIKKPRIKASAYLGYPERWLCVNQEPWATGYGNTPKEAYMNCFSSAKKHEWIGSLSDLSQLQKDAGIRSLTK